MFLIQKKVGRVCNKCLFLLASFFCVGMAVVVHQAGVVDHPWCRGEVTNVVKGEGLVEVYLVDYGPHVSVSWANLRKIQMQFITVECQVGNKK